MSDTNQVCVLLQRNVDDLICHQCDAALTKQIYACGKSVSHMFCGDCFAASAHKTCSVCLLPILVRMEFVEEAVKPFLLSCAHACGEVFLDKEQHTTHEVTYHKTIACECGTDYVDSPQSKFEHLVAHHVPESNTRIMPSRMDWVCLTKPTDDADCAHLFLFPERGLHLIAIFNNKDSHKIGWDLYHTLDDDTVNVTVTVGKYRVAMSHAAGSCFLPMQWTQTEPGCDENENMSCGFLFN